MKGATIMLRNSLICGVIVAALVSSASAQEPKPIRLWLTPAKPPTPALRYQLLPDARVSKSGNAADIYGKVIEVGEMETGLRQRLANDEPIFRRSPQKWKNDVNFFRLLVLGKFRETEVGLSYKEDQREVTSILYTDPRDLFLNGLLDSKFGTCANMAALQVALAWRLGWPLFLACVRSHYICRYDDGYVTYNIEATQTGSGFGGVKCDPDEVLIAHHNVPKIAITSGSDLRALQPREMLGVFIGLRGRHMHNTNRDDEAERDYLLAATCSRPTGDYTVCRPNWSSNAALKSLKRGNTARRKIWATGLASGSGASHRSSLTNPNRSWTCYSQLRSKESRNDAVLETQKH
jgi:hypothetical protein